MHHQIKYHLEQLQQAMEMSNLWQTVPPSPKAFESTEPFSIDTMKAHEWLQWIFIPRMYAILDSNDILPHRMAITPYIEEALKEKEGVNLSRLLKILKEIENICNQQND